LRAARFQSIFRKRFTNIFHKWRFGVNKAQSVSIVNMKFPADVREKLLEWAADNVSSMNAETVRSIRERIAREKREKAVAQ
jgi:hypothetical protein